MYASRAFSITSWTVVPCSAAYTLTRSLTLFLILMDVTTYGSSSGAWFLCATLDLLGCTIVYYKY